MEQTWIRFLQFLHEEGIYKEFRENLYIDCRQRKDDIYGKIERMKQIKAINYIPLAFVWSDTPQGNYFWGMVNDKWKENVKLNKIEI